MLVIYIYQLSNLLEVSAPLWRQQCLASFALPGWVLISGKLLFLAAEMVGAITYAVAKTKPSTWALVWPEAWIFGQPVHDEMEKPIHPVSSPATGPPHGATPAEWSAFWA